MSQASTNTSVDVALCADIIDSCHTDKCGNGLFPLLDSDSDSDSQIPVLCRYYGKGIRI